MLKPPGTNRLKLKCDKLLSIKAFKFNLRRYIEATHIPVNVSDVAQVWAKPLPGGAVAALFLNMRAGNGEGKAVQVEPVKSKLKAPGTERFILKYDNLLSRRDFRVNLRCYKKGAQACSSSPRALLRSVWRCRLTLSNPC